MLKTVVKWKKIICWWI